MRIINLIVVHCSATREDCILSPEDLDRLHRRRGFNGLPGTPGRYPDPGTAGYAPATRRATTGEIFRLPGLRTPGSFAGLERKR